MLIYLKYCLFAICLWFGGNKTSVDNSGPGVEPALAQNTLRFGAMSDGKKVIVSWTSPNERTYDYFTIERSKDGTNFVTAVMVKGAGRVSTLIDYTDIDYSPFAGMSYYRLKQTDYFGETSFSETVIVNFQFLKDGSIAPKTETIPSPDDLKEIENKVILVLLRDIKGNEFISKVKVSSDNQHLYATIEQGTLAPGSYIVMASSYNNLFSHQLIVK